MGGAPFLWDWQNGLWNKIADDRATFFSPNPRNMHPKSILIAFAHLLAIAAAAVEPRQAEPAPTVFTAERVYHAVIDQPPYLVDMTSTITWTYIVDAYVLIDACVLIDAYVLKHCILKHCVLKHCILKHCVDLKR
ncbi:uncharacterized protein LACBIDRAFT_321492 [Laccaria bicolor S238N-H82]|uniref:Predicted protein n=1 Tax=Laccaria bicolor (strain S238N-H82 / ATCC MYA-4686) TaxID=486041 RepID=B0CT30_LACBS|nr:uncharacterized protein LACBIDRAFT_321492 [Laccaria bicolor S238N-H82]EDR13868.1 predicted protein [Laccaria bicolor S238N-H82]|eukprot:XP_001874427.1 predicted protein [Laccaria bicolor S238N-H82]